MTAMRGNDPFLNDRPHPDKQWDLTVLIVLGELFDDVNERVLKDVRWINPASETLIESESGHFRQSFAVRCVQNRNGRTRIVIGDSC